MNSEDANFLVALIGCIAIGIAAGIYIGEREDRNAIAACELNLPRNQHCVLTAKPEVDHE